MYTVFTHIKKLSLYWDNNSLTVITANYCCITQSLSDTLKGAAVLLVISSTVTPSACSIRVRPPLVLSTEKTASSVMMRSTTALPVKGRLQEGRILGAPDFAVCSIVTTTYKHTTVSGWSRDKYDSTNCCTYSVTTGDQVHGAAHALHHLAGLRRYSKDTDS